MKPTAITGFAPIRVTSACATPAQRIAVPAVATNVTPGLERRPAGAPSARTASGGRSSRTRSAPRRRPATFAPATVRTRKMRNGISGSCARDSITRNIDEQHERDGQPRDRPGGSSSRGSGAFGDGVDEQREPGRDRDGACRRRSSCSRSERLSRTNRGASSKRERSPTGTLTKKIHSQPKYFGQHAAGEHADGGAGAADRAPDAERLVALRAFLEGRRDDRQRGR